VVVRKETRVAHFSCPPYCHPCDFTPPDSPHIPTAAFSHGDPLLMLPLVNTDAVTKLFASFSVSVFENVSKVYKHFIITLVISTCSCLFFFFQLNAPNKVFCYHGWPIMSCPDTSGPQEALLSFPVSPRAPPTLPTAQGLVSAPKGRQPLPQRRRSRAGL